MDKPVPQAALVQSCCPSVLEYHQGPWHREMDGGHALHVAFLLWREGWWGLVHWLCPWQLGWRGPSFLHQLPGIDCRMLPHRPLCGGLLSLISTITTSPSKTLSGTCVTYLVTESGLLPSHVECLEEDARPVQSCWWLESFPLGDWALLSMFTVQVSSARTYAVGAFGSSRKAPGNR